MKEFIIFVCTDSTEIFLSKLRSSCSNYNLPSFSLTLTVRGVSNKHCLLTFFIFIQTLPNDSSHIEDVHLLFCARLINFFSFLRGVELRHFFHPQCIGDA